MRGLSLNSSIVCHGESGLIVAARRHFKTWREAIRAAGCEKYYPSRRSWTREELLDFLRRVRRKHGYVSAGLLSRLSRPGYIPMMSAVIRLFGVIGKAKRAIGATEDGRSFRKRSSPTRPSLP